MLRQTDVIVLAGGLGTRLRAVLPPGHPKVLAPIGGRPFLRLLVDQLYQAGFRRIVLALGYGAEAVLAFIGHESWSQDLELLASVESLPLGTGGALRHALPLLKSETVIAMNGDTVVELDYDQMLKYHRRCGALITLAMARVSDASRYGRVETDVDARVIQFGEKSGQSGEPGNINAGVYVIERKVIEAIPVGTVVSWERDILSEHCHSGLYAFASNGSFIDIGTPDSFKTAAAAIVRGQSAGQS